MRSSAFLNSTALSFPEPVHSPQAAGFVVGAIAGAGAASGIAAGSAAFATGVASGAAFAATTIGAIVVQTVVGVGLSLLAQALQPGPQIPKPSARMINLAQPVVYAPYVLGRVRTGGFLGFSKAAGKYRYYVPILAAHAVNGVVQHYIDERPCTLGGDNGIASPDVGGNGRIYFFDGGPGQVVPALLKEAFPGRITDAHDFKGLSGALVRAKRVKDASKLTNIYPGAIPWAYAPVIEGHVGIYDPRTEATGYSNNAALLLAWWLTELLGAEVDWDAVAIEADVCDELVADRSGALQRRWTINALLSDDQDFETQRAQLCAACDAFLFELPDGKVGFNVGRYMAPEVTLTDRDFLSVSLSAGQAGSDAPTEIAPEYIEPDNHWREFSAGVYTVTEAGRRVRDTPQIFAVDSHNQASRIAKRLGRTKRAAWALEGSLGMIGYELIGKRFFRYQNAELGIDEVFEVGKLAREGVANFSITANSVTEEDFAFDAATEEPERPAIDDGVEGDTSAVDDIGTISAVSIAEGQIKVSWAAQDDIYGQRARVIDADGNEIIQESRIGEPIIFTGLVPGTTYTVQAQNFRVGVANVWAPDPGLEVVASGAYPGDLEITASSGGLGAVDFAGRAGTRTVGIVVYRSASSDFASAEAISDVIPASALAAFDVSTAADPGAAYFWAVPIGDLGQEGAPSGPYPLTVS